MGFFKNIPHESGVEFDSEGNREDGKCQWLQKVAPSKGLISNLEGANILLSDSFDDENGIRRFIVAGYPVMFCFNCGGVAKFEQITW